MCEWLTIFGPGLSHNINIVLFMGMNVTIEKKNLSSQTTICALFYTHCNWFVVKIKKDIKNTYQ